MNKGFLSPRAHKKGWTLIELLLGLIIFSIIALSLYGVLSTGLMVNRRFKAQGGLYRDVRWVYDQMTRDLENAIGFNLSASYPEQIPFSGDADQAVFFTLTAREIKVVRYYLGVPDQSHVHKVIIGKKTTTLKNIYTHVDIKDERKALFREEQNLPAYLARDMKDVKREILSLDIKKDGLRFSYKLKDQETGEIQQLETWKQATLPSVVMVELDFVDPSAKTGSLMVSRDIFIPAGG